MGSSIHVSTSKETQIASRLSQKRAKIFLESRFYIRKSLSSIFDIHPLKIPLTANPGEAPILPKEMGNISISHCDDACIICWHKKKVGIDIERSDRNFNYINLAEKYFNQKK